MKEPKNTRNYQGNKDLNDIIKIIKSIYLLHLIIGSSTTRLNNYVRIVQMQVILNF